MAEGDDSVKADFVKVWGLELQVEYMSTIGPQRDARQHKKKETYLQHDLDTSMADLLGSVNDFLLCSICSTEASLDESFTVLL